MTARKADRQDVVRALVRSSRIHTQEELARELGLLGFACGQGTVSRDMAEIGMSKRADGTYALDGDAPLMDAAARHVSSCECAGNLVAVRAWYGSEGVVATAIDAAALPGVMCVATGIGAVLVACRDEASASKVAGLVQRFAS